MFTGLVSDIGVVERLAPRQGGARLAVRPAHLAVDELALGESVACSGACLTVAERGAGLVSFGAVPETRARGPGRDRFEVALLPETLARTTLGDVAPGARLNLEVDVIARHVARLQAFSG